MIFYAGNPGSKKDKALCLKEGYGAMVSSSGRIKAWYSELKHLALDNGAYPAWVKGHVWSPYGFLNLLDQAAKLDNFDFAICPDIVAGGDRSLAFSEEWREKLHGISLYLAVQDGMSEASVLSVLPGYKGLFVGGTMQWKLNSAPSWLKLARSLYKKCHVGRIGTIKNLAYCRHIGVDSVDSTTPVIDGQMHIVEDSKRVMMLI